MIRTVVSVVSVDIIGRNAKYRKILGTSLEASLDRKISVVVMPNTVLVNTLSCESTYLNARNLALILQRRIEHKK